jgi:hypothetical protein
MKNQGYEQQNIADVIAKEKYNVGHELKQNNDMRNGE